jgi:hypothetical protein
MYVHGQTFRNGEKPAVNHYDLSIAFIESELDDGPPPVYCECAKGYEDPRKYVYLLHKSLYGMVQRPRAWYQLWCTLCTSYGQHVH